MNRLRTVLLALLVPSFGFTDCNYFQTVTIPATDTTKPVMAANLWIGGYNSLRLGYAEEVVTDPADAVIVVAPAIWDGGGAKSLSVVEFAQAECIDDATGAGSWIDVHYVPQNATQTGSVGSSVSNGLYLVNGTTDLTRIWTCAPGSHTGEVDYGWVADGTDFAGNAGDEFFGSITYLP